MIGRLYCLSENTAEKGAFVSNMNGKKIVSVVLTVLLMSAMAFGLVVDAGYLDTLPPVMDTAGPQSYIDYKDYYVMPDTDNTGYLSDFFDLVPFGEKYPDVYFNENQSRYEITEAAAKQYGYVFSGFTLEGQSLQFDNTSPVEVYDFYADFKLLGTGIQNNSGARLTIHDAEMLGSTGVCINLNNMWLENLYVHDTYGDHSRAGSKVVNDVVIMSCYFTMGGKQAQATPNPNHADSLQITGNYLDDRWQNNIQVIGCRFDNPTIGKNYETNAAIIVKPENWQGNFDSPGVANLIVANNWFNGGNYTIFLLGNVANPEGGIKHCTYINNKIGFGGKFHTDAAFGSVCFNTDRAPMTVSDATNNTAVDGSKVFLAFEGNGAAITMDVGTVTFLDGSQRGDPIVSLTDLTENKLTVCANVNNYTANAQTIAMTGMIVNGDGEVIAYANGSESYERYLPYVAYNDDSKEGEYFEVKEDYTDYLGNVFSAKVYPDHFYFDTHTINTPQYMTFYDLPEDLSGCRLVYAVTQQGSTGNTVIRTGAFDADGSTDGITLSAYETEFLEALTEAELEGESFDPDSIGKEESTPRPPVSGNTSSTSSVSSSSVDPTLPDDGKFPVVPVAVGGGVVALGGIVALIIFLVKRR